MESKRGLPQLWMSLIFATVYLRPQPTFKVQWSKNDSFFPNYIDVNRKNCPWQKEYRPIFIMIAMARFGLVNGIYFCEYTEFKRLRQEIL